MRYSKFMHYVQQPKEISKSLGNSDLDLWREVCATEKGNIHW